MPDKKISKIHFLIHPGFLNDQVPRMPHSDTAPNPYLKRLPEYTDLLNKYVAEAHQLKDNELMFAFAHTPSPQLSKDFKAGELYVQKLRELKKILGPRLIVLSADYDVVFNAEVMNIVKKIAAERGFKFDEHVLTEAYGEMLEVCVERGAELLNQSGELVNKTRIRTDLTDAPLYHPLEETEKKILKRRDRISF